MPNAGRDHNYIAGVHVKIFPLLSTKPHRHRTTVNAQYFVARAVIMMKRVDTVSPRVSPMVGREQLHDWRCRIIAADRQNSPVQKQVESIVRNYAVILEESSLRLFHILYLGQNSANR